MTQIKVPFTPRQKADIEANPFTLMVNDYQIRFSVEFKEFLLAERAKNKTKWKDIFAKAGYDPEVLGMNRINSIVRAVKREAVSPRGLHETASRKTPTKEQKRQRLEARVSDLENEITRLHQQIDFLKKTQMLQVLEENED